MPERTSPTSCDRAREQDIEVFVGSALDDVEAERVDLDTMLRVVAREAWNAGYRHAIECQAAREERA